MIQDYRVRRARCGERNSGERSDLLAVCLLLIVRFNVMDSVLLTALIASHQCRVDVRDGYACTYHVLLYMVGVL